MEIKIVEFFHTVSPELLDFVSKNFKEKKEVVYKTQEKSTLNFVTQTDIDVENYLVDKIHKNFPGVAILSEENYSQTSIPEKGIIWILDPICGTGNFARDIPIFVTNIVVVENGKIIAACVVDYAQKEYIWSVGNNELYINKNRQTVEKKTEGIIVDVDLIVVPRLPMPEREAYASFVKSLLLNDQYTLLSYTSSLNFAYTSLGRLDGYVSPTNHVWDVAAANFFMKQVGGTVTDLRGNDWNWSSTSVIASREKEVHTHILQLLNSAKAS